MSKLSKLAAWHILGSHALRSASAEDDELVALEALCVVAAELGMGKEAELVARQVTALRRICVRRVELKEYFDDQLRLDLGEEGGNAE